MTIEDIVEEIVGEIDDEYDRATVADVQEVSEGDFVVVGGIHPDEVEEGTGLVIPEGDYETIAGFALDQLQKIPEVGDRFDWDRWTFEVTEMDRWRIAKLRVTELSPPAPMDQP